MRIENQTHWKSRDIYKLVKSSGVDHDLSEWIVKVAHAPQTTVVFYPDIKTMKIQLPIDGPRQHPLLQLAISSDTKVLAPSVSWFVANAIYDRFHGAKGMFDGSKPLWHPKPETLIISKHEDPAKDTRFVRLKSKLVREIETAQKTVDARTQALITQKELLKKAESKLKSLKKALRDAKKRRGII